MKRRIGTLLLVVTCAVAGLGAMAAPAGADATHHISVTPNAGLSDLQLVTVTGTGFTEYGSAANWIAAMCDGALLDQEFSTLNVLTECDTGPGSALIGIGADFSGGISTEFRVHRDFAPASGAVDCQTSPNGCAIAVGAPDPFGSGAIIGDVVRVQFAPPPPPPPATIRDCAVTAWHAAKAGTPLRQVLRDFVRCVVKVLVAHHH